jgi:hypothetical protein
MTARTAAVLVLVAALATGCGGSRGTPKFQSAAGWHLLSRDGELVAADVPFAGQDKNLLSPPSRTVATLPPGRTLIWVQVSRHRDHGVQAGLALRVENMVATNPPEGFFCPRAARKNCFAAAGAIRTLESYNAGWNVGIFLFFGTDRPSRSQIADANAELARLSL